MIYIQQENIKWAPVDKDDALHMKKLKEKALSARERQSKKQEKAQIYAEEEAKMEEALKKIKKAKY